MYQLVLSKDEVPPFSLVASHPCTLLPLSNKASNGIAGFGNTLIMVTPSKDDSSDVFLNLLTDCEVQKNKIYVAHLQCSIVWKKVCF